MSSPHEVTRHTAAWRAQRFALAGGLLLTTAICSAFWSTRPLNQKDKTVGHSVAFAETIKAMGALESFHLKGKQRDTTQGGWRSSRWSQVESWYDAKQGLLTKFSNNPYATAALPTNFARTSYGLLLPNGTSYERGNSLLVVSSDAKSWRRIKEDATALVLGNVATTSRGAERTRSFYIGGQMKLTSTQASSWQSKDTQLFVMKAPHVPGNSSPATMRKIYVDKASNLVVATQDFVLLQNQKPLLMNQIELDYTRPDVSLFDPRRLQVGATQIIRKP